MEALICIIAIKIRCMQDHTHEEDEVNNDNILGSDIKCQKTILIHL